MSDLLSRRALVALSVAAAARHVVGPHDRAPGRVAGTDARLERLERQHGGRLGVAILDTASGTQISHRADERFPMLSTFKFLAAALVLARTQLGEEHLDRRVVFGPDVLVPYSPVTGPAAGTGGMTLEALCHAAVTLSDNTAGNLLLESFGGPAALTAFARRLGDGVSRLDRTEVALNEATPGDPRDTTAPAAMLRNMQALLIGDQLSVTGRTRLADWLVASTTGGARIRAGLPAGWRVGDKTGTSATGVTNDIAIAWPPGRAPVLITAYFAESPATQDVRNGVLAEVGRIAASVVQHGR